MQTRFFTALTTAARLLAAPVELMGRRLGPLSLLHTVVLDELLGDDWHAETLDMATLDIVSAVCSERKPTGYVPSFGLEGKALSRYSAALMRFGEAEQNLIWREFYVDCYGAQPRIKPPAPGAGQDWRAPYQGIMHVYLLRNLPGIKSDEVFCDWPYSQVRWTFETLFEQLHGKSRILSDVEPPEPTPEETAARHRFEDIAAKIINANLQKLQALGNPAECRTEAERVALNKKRAAIAAEQIRLIELARAGRLAYDLTEIPASAPAPSETPAPQNPE